MSNLIGRLILVVEDEPILRECLVEYLQLAGAKTDQACDGIEALASIKQNSYDVVISDMMMPNCNGIDLVAQIRKLPIPQPVCFFCTGNKELALKSSEALQISGIIEKPFSRVELIDLVASAITTKVA